MTIKNTTKNEINVTIFGINYSLPANGELTGIPEDAAKYWVKELHNFLVLSSDKEAIKEITKEVKKITK